MKQDFISAPMDKIACDIMGPLPETERKNIYILVVSDYYTKYVEAYALPDQTAQTVADCLVTEWICRFGVPLQILSDQGRNFESGLFQEVCKLLDMKKIRTSRYRPQTDGLVERYNRALKSMLKSFCQVEKSDWDHHLPYVMMAYRATIQESTKCTPNLLMFGRETRLPVDIVYGATNTEMWPSCPIDYVEWVRQSMSNAFGKVKESVKANALRQKRAYDRNSAMRTFKVGEWVWVYHLPSDKQKFGQGWKGPFLVVDKIGDLNYRVQEHKLSRKVTLHVDHIKRYEGEKFTNAFTLRRHWAEVHREEVSLLQCESCTQVFKRMSDLKKHGARKHSNNQIKGDQVMRKNKYYINPKSVTPPEGCETAVSKVRTGPVESQMPLQTSQLRNVPTCAPKTAPRKPINLEERIMDGTIETSRDLIVRKVLEAKEKVKFWSKVEAQAKQALQKFDEEKRQASIQDLKRKLQEERDIRRDCEAKMRRLQEKSRIHRQMNFLDYVNHDF